MRRVKKFLGSHKAITISVLGIVAVVAAFVGGMAAASEASKVSTLETEVGSLKSKLVNEQSEVGIAQSEAEESKEEATKSAEALTAERSLNGHGPKQVAKQEYETDYPWMAAGTVSYLTMKPIELTQDGTKWILTIEAKNTGSEPKQPFCGGAEAVLADAEGNKYTGEAFLGESSADCGEELQPGLTQTFKSAFKLPPSAKPVIAAIYGEAELEEEAKTWELPH